MRLGTTKVPVAVETKLLQKTEKQLAGSMESRRQGSETILGDFKKEQEKFVSEQRSKSAGCTEAPWVGYQEEEIIRQQILALSKERRNLLRAPPAGVPFRFEFERWAPVAVLMLQEDPALNKMRYELVPKRITEEVFWRNYFYRVSLIKQSAQLASLAAQQAESQEGKVKGSKDSVEVPGPILSGMALGIVKPTDNGMQASSSPTTSEFVSDAYNLSGLSTEDIALGMDQLGVSRREVAVLPEDEEDIPEWEKELQRELQAFEMLEGQEKASEAWEKEIEGMLQEDY
ncbi:synapse-associated protein 1-like isoform X2 [Rhinatrema bivittatum]|uniref:synapse-associated protein 1-like isoform X2 n=1 Tax=Rhinatrema bivittatum TaxID=194408 RepID=UPI00112A643A|nr:synapse-associated protein 1-like isoform X2 [Rhinatrema bivittatum]